MKTIAHLKREQGIVVPVAVAVVFAMLAVTAAAAAVTIRSTNSTQADHSTKQGLAATDAGLQATLYRLNAVRPASGDCLQVVAGAVQSGGTATGDWCSSLPGEALADGEGYKARVSSGIVESNACQTTQKRKIVVTGFHGRVRQRAITSVSTPVSGSSFRCAVIGLDQFKIGDIARVYGDVGTNGQALFEQSSYQCGAISASSWSFSNASTQTCGAATTIPVTPPKFSLPDVPTSCPGKPSLAWGAPGCNQNLQICAPSAPVAVNTCQDRITDANYNCSQPSNHSCWDKVNRELILDNGAQLTLTGNTYSFCSLEIRGAGTKLIIPRRTDGRTVIHIDSPEHCPHFDAYGGNPSQVNIVPTRAGGILNRNDDATSLMLLMNGSTDPSRVQPTEMYLETHLSGDPEWYSNMVIAAPHSEVTLRGDTRVFGAVWGKKVYITGGGAAADGARVVWSDDVLRLDASYDLGPSFSVDTWTQCAAPPNLTDAALLEGCKN